MSQGDTPPNPLEKAGYVLEFHDEFDDATLAPNKWLPLYLLHWSSRAATTPFYEIKEGALTLQIVEGQAPWCPEFDGEVRATSIQTGTFSGAVGSTIGQHRFSEQCLVREAQTNTQLYTPQYGYFEIRAKGLSSHGNHVSLWMIGYEDLPERSGEIAFFEIVGSRTTPTAATIGYGVRPWADPALRDEFYEESFALNATDYHLYGVEWTPTHIDFYLDNRPIRTIAQSPAYPMQFMLSIYEHPFAGAWSGPFNPTAPYPKTFTIDYFRAYQPINGYSRG